MRVRNSVLIGIGIISLLMASSLALYYKGQAAHYQREWNAAEKELSRIADSATLLPVSAAPKEQSRVRQAGVTLDATPRRKPEPQVFEMGTSAPLAGATVPPDSSASERFRRRPSDWMENLRTNDPQRYAEFQQRRQAMQENMQNAWVQATNYFMNRDMSRMTQSDQEEYNTMLALLEQARSLNQQLQSGLPPDQRQQVVSDLRSNIVAVVPLLNNERDKEYYDTAIAMGQSEEDAAAMVNYINQITSNTTLRAILPGIRMGGMRGGMRSP